VSGRENRRKGPISAEEAGTLVWLLDAEGAVDRRRFSIVNRLRLLRDSEEFADLPESLRQRVREIVDETQR
jgi:hypothetical protein